MNKCSVFRATGSKKPFIASLILLALAALEIACGGGVPNSLLPQTPAPAGLPTFSHVVLIVEENHNYSEVVGSSDMPYFNS